MVLKFTCLCFLFEVCDILVYSFVVTLIVCIKHVSLPSDICLWDTIGFKFVRIISSFGLSSSFSQVNMLYTSRVAGLIMCKRVADWILASFELRPLANKYNSKCCFHCHQARLLLSKFNGSEGFNFSILTSCDITSCSRTISIMLYRMMQIFDGGNF